jgi:hypothetical protein
MNLLVNEVSGGGGPSGGSNNNNANLRNRMITTPKSLLHNLSGLLNVSKGQEFSQDSGAHKEPVEVNAAQMMEEN